MGSQNNTMKASTSSVVLLFIFALKILLVSSLIEIREELIKPGASTYCQFGTEVFCNFTSLLDRKMLVLLSQTNGSKESLTIEAAPKFTIKPDLCCYKTINIINSKRINIENGFKGGESTYKLNLNFSAAENIQNEAINYLKCVNSTINELTLMNVNEFDVEQCTIDKFIAVTTGYSPSIIESTIKRLDLTIKSGSKFKVEESTIHVVDQILFNSANKSNILNTSILDIKANGMIISNIADVSLTNVDLGNLDHKSVVVDGSLTLNNVKHSRTPPEDWLVLNPGGSLKFYRSPNDENSSFIIKSDRAEFFPSKLIYLKEKKWVSATLGALFLIAVLCILFMLLWFFFFSKRNPNISSVLRIKMENQVSDISEEHPKPTETFGNHNTNQYITQNAKPPPPIRVESQPKPPAVLEDEEELVDYTENQVEGEGIEDYTDVDTIGLGFSHNIGPQVPQNQFHKPTVYPNKPCLPYQREQIPNKPALLTKKPQGSIPFTPNKSFLQQNARVLPPPPPNSLTAFGARNASKPPPPIPPPRSEAMDEVDDVYESQGESEGEYEDNEV